VFFLDFSTEQKSVENNYADGENFRHLNIVAMFK
jgi:hypothetical protein